MKRVLIRNSYGVVNFISEDMEDPSDWILENEAYHAWGSQGSYTIEILDVTAELEEKRLHETKIKTMKAYLKEILSQNDLNDDQVKCSIFAIVQILDHNGYLNN